MKGFGGMRKFASVLMALALALGLAVPTIGIVDLSDGTLIGSAGVSDGAVCGTYGPRDAITVSPCYRAGVVVVRDTAKI